MYNLDCTIFIIFPVSFLVPMVHIWNGMWKAVRLVTHDFDLKAPIFTTLFVSNDKESHVGSY